MEYRNYSRNEIAEACHKLGPILDQWLTGTDDGRGKRIDGESLLWAIAGNESTFGHDCKPRYEPAYDQGGKYLDLPLYTEYGADSAYSYGPWQVMLTNAHGYSPRELANDLDSAIHATVGYLRRYVLDARKARTLEQILDTYNSGNWRDRQTDVVKKYIADGTKRYFGENDVVATPLTDSDAGTQ